METEHLPIQLSENETRVLGCLVEKSFATPEYYPLTLNALVNACNQKSNREPILSLSENEVITALDGLSMKNLVGNVLSTGSRVFRYRHRCQETLNVTDIELVIIALLWLRGAQTPGELNTRSASMKEAGSLDTVTRILQKLSGTEVSMVIQLPRQTGQKEHRWMHLFNGLVDVDTLPSPKITSDPDTRSLREELEQVKTELQQLREEFQAFRDSFG